MTRLFHARKQRIASFGGGGADAVHGVGVLQRDLDTLEHDVVAARGSHAEVVPRSSVGHELSGRLRTAWNKRCCDSTRATDGSAPPTASMSRQDGPRPAPPPPSATGAVRASAPVRWRASNASW